MSPAASVRAALQSIIPAPVRSRRAFTSLALISIVLTGSLPAPPRFLAAAESAPPLEVTALPPATLPPATPQEQQLAAAPAARAPAPAHAPSRRPRAASPPAPLPLRPRASRAPRPRGAPAPRARASLLPPRHGT